MMNKKELTKVGIDLICLASLVVSVHDLNGIINRVDSLDELKQEIQSTHRKNLSG